MAAKKKAVKKEGIKTFVGSRVANKRFKQYMITAKTPAERAAIKSMVLGESVQYWGKDDPESDSTTE